MSQVSRPMQIALGATMLLLVVWLVALRPKAPVGDEAAAPAVAPAQSAPTPSSGAAPGTDGLTGAIDKARDAVRTANGDGAQPAAPARSTASARSSAPAATPHARHGGAPARAHAAASHVRAVKTALRRHKAVAIAFVDPKTADARAVAQEVRHVSTFGGRAVVLAVPLAQLSDYDFITNRVEVTVAPTVVIVDRQRRATTIVGFADRGEIEQRLADALAVSRRK